MTWLLWSGAVVGMLLITTIGLRVVGTRRWAGLVRSHLGELESHRVDGHSRVDATTPLRTRFDVRELAGLPAPVKRYFRAALRDGQPLIAAVAIDMAGSMNLSTTGAQWKPFTSQQRVVTRRPGFLWDARVVMVPGLPAHVEDSYIAGAGRLIAKLLGLFTMASVDGGGEIARGELMRWFAEAAWYPTALLPSQGVRWTAVDGASATATIIDGPLTLSLLFRFDEGGLIASVHAEARGAGSGQDMIMLPWDCSLSDYQMHHGMLLPMAGEAAYHRPTGRQPYFVGKVKTLRYEFLP